MASLGKHMPPTETAQGAIRVKPRRAALSRTIQPYLWLLPTLGILAVLLVYPLLYSLYLSFHNWDLLRPDRLGTFVGLSNYARLLGSTDFRVSLNVTLIWTFITVAAEFVFGFAIALILDKQVRMKGFIRTLCILPMMLTPVVVALMWKFLWSPQFGFINYLLTVLGMRPVDWFSDAVPAMGAVMVTEVWSHTSFVVLVLLAALQALPEEPYEASRIDGASKIQSFWYITVPLLTPAIVVVLIFRTIFAFRAFDLIWVLTGGGPVNSTLTLSVYIYRLAFRYWDLGYASALAWVMLIISMIISIIYLLVLRSKTD
ncbi:MAG: carbohydrate ABC transporter permease [Chloroflexota bacterium]